jgi:hypothetical protein
MADPVLDIRPLGNRWQTVDPFLFCVHHIDHYPQGNEQYGPAVPLTGHDIGQDFAGVDGWRMYHGDVVPGFPQHPHHPPRLHRSLRFAGRGGPIRRR